MPICPSWITLVRTHRALAVVLATMLVPLVVGSAAAKTTPVVTVTPTVTGATVSVQVDVDQKTNQVASCSYVLDANGGGLVRNHCAQRQQGQPLHHRPHQRADRRPHHHSHGRAERQGDWERIGHVHEIVPPRMFAVAFTDTNGDHAYQAGTDDLIAALIDSNGDGTPDAGDTVVANEFPLTVDPVNAWGQFGVKSDAVTHVSIVAGNVSAQSATGSYSWDFALDIEVFDSVSILGRNSLVGSRTTATRASVTPIASPSSPTRRWIRSPDTVSSSVHDTTDNEFIDIATDLP